MSFNTEPDKLKQDFLFKLAQTCLKSLEVGFTSAFLRETISKAYSLVFEATHTDELEPGKVTVADKEDPSNLAIALLEALKRYHIKNEVANAPAGGGKDTALLILSSPDKNCNYAGLLFVQQSGLKIKIPESQSIENTVVLKANEFSGEPGYAQNRNKENLIRAFAFLFSFLLAAAFGAAVYKGVENVPVLLWLPSLSLSLAGCFICYNLYLLEKTNTYTSAFLKKMCSLKKNDFDCKDVISSSGSKIFGLISHTDIGLVYFSSLLCLVVTALLSSEYNHYISLLFWLAVLPLPYTVFSIYYQVRVIKKICMLCIMTQVILWSHFAFFLLVSSKVNISLPHPGVIIEAGLILGTSAVLYALFTAYTKAKSGGKLTSAELFKIKNSTFFFEEALSQQITLIQDNFPQTFSLGNSAAREKLHIVLSLFCAPCGDKLKDILKLADWFGEQIDIHITIKPDAPAASFIKELMVHIGKGATPNAIQALSNWYAFFQKEKSSGNYNASAIATKWYTHHPSPAATAQAETLYEAHSRFFEKHPMPFTPLMQYRGKLLPDAYYDLELLSHRIAQSLEQEQMQHEQYCEYA